MPKKINKNGQERIIRNNYYDVDHAYDHHVESKNRQEHLETFLL